jgi:hypothetical protein
VNADVGLASLRLGDVKSGISYGRRSVELVTNAPRSDEVREQSITPGERSSGEILAGNDERDEALLVRANRPKAV